VITMKIGVASGKGGTGKTTVAVNLALSLKKCTLVDCDVEEPNCAIFLNTDLQKLEEVRLPVPVFDLDRCTYCGKCADFCMYNAIAVFPEKLLFFQDICHSCGGCAILCPEDAVSESTKKIGEIDHARIAELDIYQGKLEVGEPLAVPIIRRVKGYAKDHPVVIYDAPPGTACPVIETLKDTDIVLLVTEPTPFGLHDLKLAVDVVRKMNIPFAVIINRDGVGNDCVDRYCEEEGIEIVMRIPNDRRIAELYSNGIPFILELQEYREIMLQSYWRIYQIAEAEP
jgi:MinD superfamily P-loop ATPase